MDYEAYIQRLEDECDVVYQLAEQARAKGLDPRLTVEIPRASDLADRTQKLLDFLHPRRTAEQIRELTEIHDGNRELVAVVHAHCCGRARLGEQSSTTFWCSRRPSAARSGRASGGRGGPLLRHARAKRRRTWQ